MGFVVFVAAVAVFVAAGFVMVLVALFLQAANTYFHICSRRLEIYEPAPRQPAQDFEY